jgi:hypothetical protein
MTAKLAGREILREGAIESLITVREAELEFTPSFEVKERTLLPSPPIRVRALENTPPEQLAVCATPEIPELEISTERPVSQVPVRVNVELIWVLEAGVVVVRTGGRLSTVTWALGPAALEAFAAESSAVPAAIEMVRTPFPVQLERVTVLVVSPEPETALEHANVPDTVFTLTFVAKVALESTEEAPV